MYYVLTDGGVEGEFNTLERAHAYCDFLNEIGVEAWISEFDDDYGPSCVWD